MVVFGRNLELVNVQRPDKKELKKTLSDNALLIALKSAYIAKKANKKNITSSELKHALKKLGNKKN